MFEPEVETILGRSLCNTIDLNWYLLERRLMPARSGSRDWVLDFLAGAKRGLRPESVFEPILYSLFITNRTKLLPGERRCDERGENRLGDNLSLGSSVCAVFAPGLL